MRLVTVITAFLYSGDHEHLLQLMAPINIGDDAKTQLASDVLGSTQFLTRLGALRFPGQSKNIMLCRAPGWPANARIFAIE